MPSIKGKRVLVTGGSRGVGAEICRQAAAEGAIVAVNYASSKEAAEKLVASLAGSGHVIVQGNAFTHAGCDGIVADARKALGGIDAIVSNQGWTKFADWRDLESVADDEWMKIYNANVMSHLWLIQAAKKDLVANKGSFIITGSIAGSQTSGSSLAYSVAKAGCLHLTRGLAKSCAPDIRVNCVAPGLMLTEWAAGFSEAQIQASKDITLLGGTSEVEDVAGAFIMLLRNGSITGEIIEVSAGYGKK